MHFDHRRVCNTSVRSNETACSWPYGLLRIAGARPPEGVGASTVLSTIACMRVQVSTGSDVPVLAQLCETDLHEGR